VVWMLVTIEFKYSYKGIIMKGRNLSL